MASEKIEIQTISKKPSNYVYSDKQKKLIISALSTTLIIICFVGFWVVFGLYSSGSFDAPTLEAFKTVMISYTPIASSIFLVVKIILMVVQNWKHNHKVAKKVEALTSNIIQPTINNLKFDTKKLGEKVLENDNFVFYKKDNTLTCVSKKAFGDKEFSIFISKSLDEYSNLV